MREIKFRAWDKEEKEMMYYNPLSFLDDSDGSPVGAVQTHCESHYIDSHFSKSTDKKTILMQYTGLKDKNDKEIYEGDIVRVTNVFGAINFGDSETEEVKVVKWDDLGWAPFCEPGGIDCDHWCSSEENKIEIIGTIYQNPELLGT